MRWNSVIFAPSKIGVIGNAVKNINIDVSKITEKYQLTALS